MMNYIKCHTNNLCFSFTTGYWKHRALQIHTVWILVRQSGRNAYLDHLQILAAHNQMQHENAAIWHWVLTLPSGIWRSWVHDQWFSELFLSICSTTYNNSSDCLWRRNTVQTPGPTLFGLLQSRPTLFVVPTGMRRKEEVWRGGMCTFKCPGFRRLIPESVLSTRGGTAKLIKF